MSEPFDEYGDRLRRALHAEADAVMPSAEGLERIRGKINKRRERHLGLWFAVPWLRPVAAVAAAVVVSVVTVSASPALKNFVQTGHFSPDANSDDRRTSVNDGRSQGQWPPGGSVPPAQSTSPSPTARPTNTGKHVVTAPCPPGEGTVTPTAGTTAAAKPDHPDTATKVTCQPSGGTSTHPVPGGSTTPPPSSPAQPSTTAEPPSTSQPAPNASP